MQRRRLCVVERSEWNCRCPGVFVPSDLQRSRANIRTQKRGARPVKRFAVYGRYAFFACLRNVMEEIRSFPGVGAGGAVQRGNAPRDRCVTAVRARVLRPPCRRRRRRPAVAWHDRDAGVLKRNRVYDSGNKRKTAEKTVTDTRSVIFHARQKYAAISVHTRSRHSERPANRNICVTGQK